MNNLYDVNVTLNKQPSKMDKAQFKTFLITSYRHRRLSKKAVTLAFDIWGLANE
jgi:hypothetical protein